MYRCKICQDVSRPGTPRLVHIVYRTVPNRDVRAHSTVRQEIAQEIPVCRNCLDYIGISGLKFVLEKRSRKIQKTSSTPLVRPSINEKVSIGRVAKVVHVVQSSLSNHSATRLLPEEKE